MNLQDRTTAALAWINAQLAICNATTGGPWQYSDIESIGGGSVYDLAPKEPGGGCIVCSIRWDNEDTMPIHRPRYETEADANGIFIAAARTGYPAMLEGMKVAIEALIARGAENWPEADVILTNIESLQ